ncbi:hypothetical protein TNCV_4208411 [Trichonephila clavipes]|nr:hypothetical protein TNCV_4208411 [Trichonephila clavipes]
MRDGRRRHTHTLLRRNELADSESEIIPLPGTRLCANKAKNVHLCQTRPAHLSCFRSYLLGIEGFCRIGGFTHLVSEKHVQKFQTFHGRNMKCYQSAAGKKERKKTKRKLEIAESQKNVLHKFSRSTTSLPSSSASENPQCTSIYSIFSEAEAIDVIPVILTCG